MNSELTGTRKFEPKRLRYELQQEETLDLKRRRGIIVLSLVGMASMTAVTLLQTGIVKHLPDPPVGNFDSDRVNSSDTAYRFGVPDGSFHLQALRQISPSLRLAVPAGRAGSRGFRSSHASKRASKQPLRAGISIRCPPRKKLGAAIAYWAPSRTSALQYSQFPKPKRRWAS